jgi:hypothetical protein
MTPGFELCWIAYPPRERAEACLLSAWAGQSQLASARLEPTNESGPACADPVRTPGHLSNWLPFLCSFRTLCLASTREVAVRFNDLEVVSKPLASANAPRLGSGSAARLSSRSLTRSSGIARVFAHPRVAPAPYAILSAAGPRALHVDGAQVPRWLAPALFRGSQPGHPNTDRALRRFLVRPVHPHDATESIHALRPLRAAMKDTVSSTSTGLGSGPRGNPRAIRGAHNVAVTSHRVKSSVASDRTTFPGPTGGRGQGHHGQTDAAWRRDRWLICPDRSCFP